MMNLKKLFCAFAIVVLGTQLDALAQKGKPLFPQAPGMQTYTFRHSLKKSVPAVLDSIKSLGINILESNTGGDGVGPEAFRKLLDERGMKCVSVGADYNELVKDPAEVARKAKIIGASYVMVAWIPHDQFNLDVAKKAVADFNKAGKVLAESGITLCYHTHGFEFVPYNGETLFDYMAKNTDPKYVSFELDMLWAFHGGQDPAKLLLKYPTRWKLIHLKDLKKGVKGDLTGGTSVENDVALGTGQLDIPSILKAAKKVGVKYYFIEDESSSYGKQIPETIKYLKSLKE